MTFHHRRQNARVVGDDGRELGRAGIEVWCGLVLIEWTAWTGARMSERDRLCEGCYGYAEAPTRRPAAMETVYVPSDAQRGAL